MTHTHITFNVASHSYKSDIMDHAGIKSADWPAFQLEATPFYLHESTSRNEFGKNPLMGDFGKNRWKVTFLWLLFYIQNITSTSLF